MDDFQIRRDRDALVSVITGMGTTFMGNSCRCPLPGHNDRHASAGIFQSDDGVWRFKCQKCDNKGGDIFDMEEIASGIPVSTQLKAASGRTDAKPVAAEKPIPTYDSIESAERNDYSIRGFTAKYRYTDTLYVYRIPKQGGGKRFCPLHQRADGKWIAKKPDGILSLYAPISLTHGSVIFVEGEKCVDILAALGIPAVTAMGGAGASKEGKFDWSVLSGKVVYLWPDNDDDNTGQAHMDRVARHVERVGGTPKMVDISDLGLPPKGDIEQFLARYETRKEKVAALAEVFKTSKQSNIHTDMLNIAKREQSGEGLPVPWPWRMFNDASRFSTPGTVSLIVGQAGSSKSFLLIEAAAFWADEGIPFALYELEDSKETHLYRALAQRTHNSELTNPEWRAENFDKVEAALREQAKFIEKMNRSLYGETDEQMTKAKLMEWMEARAKEGARVIAIDPITAKKSSREQWLDDESFMDDIKRVARTYNTNIVLVSHPKKGFKGDVDLDNIAGGAAFGRFVHKVAWMQPYFPSTKNKIKNSMATIEMEHNRTLHIVKSRDTRGQGMKIAMQFGADLCFYEKGFVVSKDAAEKRGEVSSFEQRAIANSQQVKQPYQTQQQPIEETYEDADDLLL